MHDCHSENRRLEKVSNSALISGMDRPTAQQTAQGQASSAAAAANPPIQPVPQVAGNNDNNVDVNFDSGIEVERHHITLLLLEKKLYLAPIGKYPQRILDVGTGTGIWAFNVAEETPSAVVTGTDISPVSQDGTLAQHPNFIHINDDAQEEWYFRSDHFDFVHMRYLYGAIDDWGKLFRQAYTHLRPGGWVESLELDIEIHSENPKFENDPDHIFKKWWQLFLECGQKTGWPWDIAREGRQKRYMRDAGFRELVTKSWKLPIGGWSEDKKLKEIGVHNGEFIWKSIDAFTIHPIGEVLGWSREQLATLVNKMLKALMEPKTFPYYTVHMVYGRKPKRVLATTEGTQG
ncbi:hypothetical protein FZEAL_6756 [Fusarium zealandicum]|uniref:Methyltransferase n=1 Tax=Fusarium zealandicum TaxID=1053134 RepID=A0A8H4UH55_9HYPO|nr:hypothetical protein FZEAL_6756 [Fusarium zealandicum]